MKQRQKSVGLRFLEEQASWLKLQNYAELENGSLELWFRQFALRIDLRRSRPLMRRPGSQIIELQRCVLDALIAQIRNRGVITDKHLPLFLQAEEFLYPAGFSVLHSVSSNGCHIRPMTVGDHLRVAEAIKEKTLLKATEEYRSRHWHGSFNLTTIDGSEQLLNENLKHHVREPSIALTEAFLRVDLRLPQAVIMRQVRAMLGQLATDDGLFPLRPDESRARRRVYEVKEPSETAKKRARAILDGQAQKQKTRRPKEEMKLEPDAWF